MLMILFVILCIGVILGTIFPKVALVLGTFVMVVVLASANHQVRTNGDVSALLLWAGGSPLALGAILGGLARVVISWLLSVRAKPNG